MEGTLLFTEGKLTLSDKKLAMREENLAAANTALTEAQAEIDALKVSLADAETAPGRSGYGGGPHCRIGRIAGRIGSQARGS